MFNIDNPSKNGVGAIRTCTKAFDKVEINCTDWFRSTNHAENPVSAATTALMMLFDPVLGQWPNFWIGANCIEVILDSINKTGDNFYMYAVEKTFEGSIGLGFGNFTNEYIDDSGWWGLAWMHAYDATFDEKYLNMAKSISNYMDKFWDNSVCSGGIWSTTSLNYKNTITNELFFKLNAGLYNRDVIFYNRAIKAFFWLNSSGLKDSDNVFFDGMLQNCSIVKDKWSYNSGVILGALVEFYDATNNMYYLDLAQTIADAAIAFFTRSGDVLIEKCEEVGCGPDGAAFKGIFGRNLLELALKLGTTKYVKFFHDQSNSILQNSLNSLAMIGLKWMEPFDIIDLGSQMSGLSALVSVPINVSSSSSRQFLWIFWVDIASICSCY
jgi:predicted alpha-1,6-mannanase (GH76 family)